MISFSEQTLEEISRLTTLSVELEKEYSRAQKEASQKREQLGKSLKQLRSFLSTPEIRKLRSSDDTKVSSLVQLAYDAQASLTHSLPRKPSTLLQILLGDMPASLSAAQKLQFKSSYEKFKAQWAVFLAIILSAALFGLHVDSFAFAMIFVFYFVLTVREDVLAVNGSRTRAYWRVHHLMSTIATGLLLFAPKGEAWQQVRTAEIRVMLVIFLSQLLQTRYQLARIYALNAFASPKDKGKVYLTSGEVPEWNADLALWVIVFPMLLINIWQGSVAARCLHVYLTFPGGGWMGVMGFAISVMLSVGNLWSNLRSLVRKMRTKELQAGVKAELQGALRTVGGQATTAIDDQTMSSE
eukprot:gnl/Dysnectes_brevis/613_a678_2173.p1 GENE.gnl/Dysnectes_brevis/613_a678_2173~~gnl/Dysnectes_brevis/613_a678_2173.p1  ORF type:complete len:354 (+),score=91.40 gnl/Dysnectes_brevis/613_a678_2173:1104-2165(+)